MSNCTTCNKCKEECGCIPKGLNTPNMCPSDLPPCPQPSPCGETFDSKCIIYTGDPLPCLGVDKDNNLEQVILALSAKLSPIFCVQCIALAVPANNATNVPCNQVLVWDSVLGATSYDVYFGTSSSNPTLVSAGQINTSYTPPAPLVPGTTYYWKIVPKNGTSTASNCPTYTFNTVAVSCVHPLSYMLDTVMDEQTAPAVDIPTLITSIHNFLDNGALITNCNFCCPDCTQTKRYALTSAPLFAEYYTDFYSLPSCPPVCCTEVDATLNAMTTQLSPSTPSLTTAFKNMPPVTNCCGTGFSECSQTLKDALGTSVAAVYNVDGIVEESTINNQTSLCILADFLSTLPGSVTYTQKASIVAAILERGFFVQCRPEGTIISGYTGYKNYVSTVQNLCLCYQPCVIT